MYNKLLVGTLLVLFVVTILLNRYSETFNRWNTFFDVRNWSNYTFNKWVFRFAFIVVLFLLGIAWYVNGMTFKSTVALNCPAKSDIGMQDCLNPLAEYKNKELCKQLVEDNKEEFDQLCADDYRVCDICHQKYIPRGFEIKHEPPFLYRYFTMLVLLILLLSLIVNHILFNKKFNFDKFVKKDFIVGEKNGKNNN